MQRIIVLLLFFNLFDAHAQQYDTIYKVRYDTLFVLRNDSGNIEKKTDVTASSLLDELDAIQSQETPPPNSPLQFLYLSFK